MSLLGSEEEFLGPDRGLAFWEALDELLDRESPDAWVAALQRSLGASKLDTHAVFEGAVLRAGQDLEDFWRFLDRSPKTGGYRRLAGDSFSTFRATELGHRLRMLLTTLRLYQSCRVSADPLVTYRLVARLVLMEIRFRRRFAGDPQLAQQLMESSNRMNLLVLDSNVDVRAETGSSELLQLAISVDGSSTTLELYRIVGENRVESARLSDLSALKPHEVVWYIRAQRQVVMEQASYPEASLLTYVTDVEIDPEGRVHYGPEWGVYTLLQPKYGKPTEPIGPVSDEEQALWEEQRYQTDRLTRRPATTSEAVETKDAVIEALLTAFEGLSAEDVSAYTVQVCVGYLSGLLGYSQTEAEHEESPRSNSYRDYLSKEVENSIRRLRRDSPKVTDGVG